MSDKNNVMMVSLRTFTLVAKCGVTVPFESLVPRPVPIRAMQEAMEQGAQPVDAVDQRLLGDKTINAKVPVSFQSDVRKSMIYLAVKDIAAHGDARKDFAGNTPKATSVADRIGSDVTQKEVLDVYQQFLSAQSEGREDKFEISPQAANVMRVVQSKSKSDLLLLLDELGDAPLKKSVENADAKEIRTALFNHLNGTTRS